MFLVAAVVMVAAPATSLSQGLISDTALYNGSGGSPFGGGLPLGATGDSPEANKVLAERAREAEEAEAKREDFVDSAAGREERAESRSAFDDLSDASALEVMKREFSGELRARVPDAETLLGGDRVVAYASDFVARVDGTNGRPDRIIDSQVPLRTPDGREPVDLDLQRSGDTYAPDAGLVEVELPAEIEDGSVAGRLRITPDGHASAVKLDADTLAYPNALTSVDVAINTTPYGFETFHHLRAPGSPEVFGMDVDAPAGAVMRAVDGGGAEVVDAAGAVKATVSPPSAVDAHGTEVPISMAVTDGRLELTARHRDKPYAYPILADPDVVIKDDWACSTGTSCTATWFRGHDLSGLQYWTWSQSAGSGTYGVHKNCANFGAHLNTCYGRYWGGGTNWNGNCHGGAWSCQDTGLHVIAHPNQPQPWGTIGKWVYRAPGTTTQIIRADFGAKFQQNRGGNNNPFLFTGIYSLTDGNWVPAVPGSPGNHGTDAYAGDFQHHWNANFGYHRPGPQEAAFGYWSNGAAPNPMWRDIYMGAAIIQLTDPDIPYFTGTDPTGPAGWDQSKWLKSGSVTFSPTAKDNGLGVNTFSVTAPKHPSGTHSSTPFNHGCTGAKSFPCFAQTPLGTGQLTMNAANLPEGHVPVTMQATDALGRAATPVQKTIKVDYTKPDVEADGTAKPPAGEWLPAGDQYVNVHAEDPTSGVASAELKIGTTVVGSVSPGCASGGCDLDEQFPVNVDDIDPQTAGAQPLSGGPHTATLTVRDVAGNEDASTWTLRVEKTPPTLTLGGPLKDAEGQELAAGQTYRLDVQANDAAGSTPRSGLGAIEVSVDGEDPDIVEQDCASTDGCSMTRTFDFATDDWGSGQHSIDVTATDLAGNEQTQSFNVGVSDSGAAQCTTTTAPSSVPGASPVSSQTASTLMQSSVPEAFADASAVTWLGRLIQPTLVESDPLIYAARDTFGEASVAKQPQPGVTQQVETMVQPSCMKPTQVSTEASQPTDNGNDSVMYANLLPATDSLFRPSPTGVDSVLQLRDNAAPQTLSWTVALQPGQALRELSTGDVAVVEPADPSATAPDPEALPAPASPEARKDALSDTDLAMELASDDLERAQNTTADEIIALVPKPWLVASNGQGQPVSLNVDGSKVLLNAPHNGSSAYPLTGGMQFHSRDAIETADTVRTADSLPPEAFSTNSGESTPPASSSAAADPEDDQRSEDGVSGSEADAGELDGGPTARAAADPTKNFQTANLTRLRVGISAADPAVLSNPRLSGGGQLNPAFIRPFAPFNTLRQPTRFNSQLWTEWSQRARATGRRGDLAIGRDAVMESGGTKSFSARTYGRYLTQFLQTHGDPNGDGNPADGAVNNLMAWNEPNFRNRSSNVKKGDPLRAKPWHAARLWVKAMQACFPNASTTRCGTSQSARGLVVAGDFAGQTRRGDIVKFRSGKRTIKKPYAEAYADYLFDKVLNSSRTRFPQAWSYHTYTDTRLYLYKKGRARYSAPQTKRYYGLYRNPDFEYSKSGSQRKPQIWLTEAGVPYASKCSTDTTRPRCSGRSNNTLLVGMRQQRNAIGFLLSRIAKSYSSGSPNAEGRINRIYYFNLLSARGKCSATVRDTRIFCEQDEFGLIGHKDDQFFYTAGAAQPGNTSDPVELLQGVTTSDVSGRGDRRLSFCLLSSGRKVSWVRQPSSLKRTNCGP